MTGKPAKTLLFQGTGSDVGKSQLVAGLARAFTLRGLKVLPFKPQNMSNNAAVTADGGEIGRAQALQARAARAPLSVHMNPVLLKPQSEVGAQLVVQGRVEGNAKAAEYQHIKAGLMPRVLESFGKRIHQDLLGSMFGRRAGGACCSLKRPCVSRVPFGPRELVHARPGAGAARSGRSRLYGVLPSPMSQ